MLLSLAKLSYETDRHVVCRLCDMGDVNIKATQVTSPILIRIDIILIILSEF